jgi:hypothetical protein
LFEKKEFTMEFLSLETVGKRVISGIDSREPPLKMGAFVVGHF